jgi:hypothetical protein
MALTPTVILELRKMRRTAPGSFGRHPALALWAGCLGWFSPEMRAAFGRLVLMPVRRRKERGVVTSFTRLRQARALRLVPPGDSGQPAIGGPRVITLHHAHIPSGVEE